MPHFKTITVPCGLIGIWHLTESSTDLTRYFSIGELEDFTFQQFTNEKRKVEWLAIRCLVKQMIGSDFLISYTESGKPILSHIKFRHLSISHSRDFAIVFVHENLDVGIDIENISRNYTAIEKRYLSDEELIIVNRDAKLQCLYWCAKEAIFKLVPDEGVEFKQQILISSFNPELEDHFLAKYTSENTNSIYQLHFLIFSGHCVVWVAG